MSSTFIYQYPRNIPTSSVRLYRFALNGERNSSRINLLLQSIYGDLHMVHTILDTCEGYDLNYTGGYFMNTRDSLQFLS
jgi:hypothetical protein